MDKIEVTIQYTPEDLQIAYKLHLKKTSPFRSRLVLFLGIIIVILGFILVFLQSMAGIINWVSWFFVVYGLLISMYYFWKYSRMGKVAFKKLIEFHHPFTFTITENGVKAEGKTVKSENTWDHYYQIAVTKEMILLYPNKMRFVLFPGKYFTEAQFERLTNWVWSHYQYKEPK